VAEVFVEQIVGANSVLRANKIAGIFLIRDEQQAGAALPSAYLAVKLKPSRRQIRNVPGKTPNTPCMHPIPVPRIGTFGFALDLAYLTNGRG
jgi:hypothetical protein